MQEIDLFQDTREYYQGYRAFHKGARMSQCPYNNSEEQRTQAIDWCCGFAEACRDTLYV